MEILQLSNINVVLVQKAHFVSGTLPNSLFDQSGREK